ncbi:hypothetical protein B0T10DRAFT_600786 [Thelonectria olida]|uniref:Uncharacterized protein n=1 Tax=Thelonectria olida TaxID=1576542 RepID=A0A9P8WJA3_9HYPO|nr:hypothetical protein B0T10DRAFT_600786 [Thelonectria olida]
MSEDRAHTIGMLASVIFWSLFAIRYVAVMTNFGRVLRYRAIKPTEQPAFNSYDCSVIIPISDLGNPNLETIIRSILQNNVYALYLVTVGPGRLYRLNNFVSALRTEFPDALIHVGAKARANKRQQLAYAIREIPTNITVLADDGVFWPQNFLEKCLAPFEDARVGGVSVNKRVSRQALGFSWESFRSFLAHVYFQNIEYKNMAVANLKNHTINVVDGQTAFYRTEILNERDFLHSFLTEDFFFHKCGPFHAGDDSFITRWLVKTDWKIVFQSTGEDCIRIPLRDNKTSVEHLERRLRNNYRSHLKSYDAFFVASFALTPIARNDMGMLGILIAIHLFTKLVKIVPVFTRNPKDIVFLPALFFADYAFGLLKFKAVLDLADTHWYPDQFYEANHAQNDNGDLPWSWGHRRVRAW